MSKEGERERGRERERGSEEERGTAYPGEKLKHLSTSRSRILSPSREAYRGIHSAFQSSHKDPLQSPIRHSVPYTVAGGVIPKWGLLTPMGSISPHLPRLISMYLHERETKRTRERERERESESESESERERESESGRETETAGERPRQGERETETGGERDRDRGREKCQRHRWERRGRYGGGSRYIEIWLMRTRQGKKRKISNKWKTERRATGREPTPAPNHPPNF